MIEHEQTVLLDDSTEEAIEAMCRYISFVFKLGPPAMARTLIEAACGEHDWQPDEEQDNA